jgi:hypothetical protein|tara:strand:+ start:14232 stop:15158 length:927 start_codon:yes stop_codon:yes gene_type:complete
MSEERESASWTVEKLERNTHRVTFDLDRLGQECWILLRSDAHHDSPCFTLCENALERAHLEAAKKAGACVIDNGDAFDLMGGKWDKRSSKAELRPHLAMADNYLDAVINDYADFLEPYAHSIGCWSQGNHESSILRHHETDVTTRLCEQLRYRTGAKMYEGGYTGWVFFTLRRKVKNKGKKYRERNARTIKMYRTHGYGGSAPVTKGVLNSGRRSAILPDARLVVSGHIHQEWQFPIQRMRVTPAGRVFQDEQLHLALPSYKDSIKDGWSKKNWAIERGFPPSPVGAIWLRLTLGKDEQIEVHVERAK